MKCGSSFGRNVREAAVHCCCCRVSLPNVRRVSHQPTPSTRMKSKCKSDQQTAHQYNRHWFRNATHTTAGCNTSHHTAHTPSHHPLRHHHTIHQCSASKQCVVCLCDRFIHSLHHIHYLAASSALLFPLHHGSRISTPCAARSASHAQSHGLQVQASRRSLPTSRLLPTRLILRPQRPICSRLPHSPQAVLPISPPALPASTRLVRLSSHRPYRCVVLHLRSAYHHSHSHSLPACWCCSTLLVRSECSTAYRSH